MYDSEPHLDRIHLHPNYEICRLLFWADEGALRHQSARGPRTL